MAEAEELCQRIAIINHGEIVVLDSPEALKKRITGESVIEASVKTGQTNPILDVLKSYDGKTSVEIKNAVDPAKIIIRSCEPEKILEILSPFINQDHIIGMEVRNQTLEDVYVTLVKGSKE